LRQVKHAASYGVFSGLRAWLQSIHPDCVSSALSNGSLALEISIELGESITVTVVDEATQAGSAPEARTDINEDLRLSLSTLPPLLLHVILPPTYPLHNPPEISSLSATHSWLPQSCIHALQRDLLDMWRHEEVVLYDWVEYLRNAEFLQTSQILSVTDAGNIIGLVST
jgi:E3 ubiquitin-protein ligase RNF14